MTTIRRYYTIRVIDRTGQEHLEHWHASTLSEALCMAERHASRQYGILPAQARQARCERILLVDQDLFKT